MNYLNQSCIRYQVGPSSFVDLDTSVSGTETDHTSNAIILDNEDALKWLYHRGPGPVQLSLRTLRLLLHELTHHAAFASKNGAVLSALWTSVSGRAQYVPPPKEKGALSLHERDDLVARLFDCVMEPIFEGTALFAEHDTKACDENLTSHAIMHLLHLNSQTSDRKFDVDEIIKKNDRDLNDLLDSARNSDFWVGHKANLLMQPITGPKTASSYLLGYLATKQMYFNNIEREDFGWQPDLFLFAVINHWLADKEIASLLLDVGEKDVISVQNTIQRLFERIQDIGEDRTNIISKKNFDPYSEERIPSNARQVELEELYYGLRTAADSLNIFVPRFLKHRLTVRMGYIRVRIEVSEDGSSAAIYPRERGDSLFSCPILEDLEFESGISMPGVVEFVRTYTGDHFCVCVLLPQGLLAVREIGYDNWNDSELVQLFVDMPSIEQVGAASRQLEKNPRVFRWSEEGYSDFFEHVVGSARQLRDHMFRQIAFPDKTADQIERIAEALGTDGFASIVGGNRQLLSLARLSLLFGGSGTSMEVASERSGMTRSAIERQIKEFNEKMKEEVGLSPFSVSPNNVVSLI